MYGDLDEKISGKAELSWHRLATLLKAFTPDFLNVKNLISPVDGLSAFLVASRQVFAIETSGRMTFVRGITVIGPST